MTQTIEDLNARILVIENILTQTGLSAPAMREPGTPSVTLKRNLKLNMAAQNVTLSELARRAGVSKQTICDWQSGLVPRSVVNLKRIATALGVTLDQLVFGGEE